MKKVLVKNLIVFIAYTLLWLAIDYVDVKVTTIPDFPHELPVIALLVAASFIGVNRGLFQGRHVSVRCLLIATLTSLLTVVWFGVSLFTLLHFHIAIGGSL